MANKTANLYARIEPETKICAESIMKLGTRNKSNNSKR